MIILEGQKDGYMPVELLAEDTGEARIYLCESQNGRHYVARVFDRLLGTTYEVRKFLYSCESPYIMKLLDHGITEIQGQKCVFEIYEYMPEGTWDLRAPVGPAVLETSVIPCLNEALHAMHEAGLLHRDVKANNLYRKTLDDGRLIACLGDFGISVVRESDGNYSDAALAFTPGYVPAEVLGSGMYSPASDYYAMAVTLYYLLTGRQIYEGLTPDEIMVRTRRGDLMSYENLPPRLAELMEGLTVQDPRYRWGYNEVCKWLMGAKVPVFRHSQENQLLEPPYMLTPACVCYSLRELAEGMAALPAEGSKHLYEGLIADGVRKEYQYLSNALKELVLNRFPHARIAGLTAAIKLIYPGYQGFYWDGIHYKGLNDLLLALRSELGKGSPCPATEELLTSGILSYYYGDMLTGEDMTILDLVEKTAQTNPAKALSLLTLRLLPEAVYQVNDEIQIHSMEEYVSYLVENRQILRSLVTTDFNKPYFALFVEMCGYKNQFNNWKTYFYHGGHVVDDTYLIGNICQFLGGVCPTMERELNLFILDEIGTSPEYWLKDHLDLYEMDEMMSRMVHDNFNEVKLSADMPMKELLQEHNRLKECMRELRRDLLNNYLLLEQGVYDSAGYRIIPLHADGLFVMDQNQVMVPVGWLRETQGKMSRNLIERGYSAMAEEASAYMNKVAGQADRWSRECREACKEKKKSRKAPSPLGGIISTVCTIMAGILLARLSENHIKGSSVITLAGFGLAVLVMLVWLIADLRRFVKCFMWKRLTSSADRMIRIRDELGERLKQLSVEAPELIKGQKHNLETALQVERAAGSSLLTGYRLKNGLARYFIFFILACGILGMGLVRDGQVTVSGSGLKKEILTLFDWRKDSDEDHAKAEDKDQKEDQASVELCVVAVSSARLRTGPGTDYAILNSYEEGTEMIPTGRVQSDGEYDWYEVTGPDDSTGWMRVDTIDRR